MKKQTIPLSTRTVGGTSTAIESLVSYRLTENQSISRAADWINRMEVLETFRLKPFEQRTLYRALETIGENYLAIIADIQDALFQRYGFGHTNPLPLAATAGDASPIMNDEVSSCLNITPAHSLIF